MRRSAPWLTALLQTTILLAAVTYAAPWQTVSTNSLPTPRRAGDVTLTGRQARPVFNGSVVPGGVYTLGELRVAIARDPIVAAHYRGIDVNAMRIVTLTAGKAAYVSYRRGAQTYWTRNRVWLKAGETVLTDGTATIRARCGNCVSDVKQSRVAAVEPAHGELDDFVVPPTPETGVDAFAAEAEAANGDLFAVPLASTLLASLQPAGPLLAPDLDNPLALRPGGASPALWLPGGRKGNVPVVTVPPGALPFVPVDLSGSPTPTTTGTTGGTTTGGATTGGPGGTTTGVPADVTTTGPGGPTTTGFPGDTIGGSGDTTGRLTDGTVLPTTTVGDTSGTPAPEPQLLWLVTCGVLGVASRRLRRK
jgi:hypothetical protein